MNNYETSESFNVLPYIQVKADFFNVLAEIEKAQAELTP